MKTRIIFLSLFISFILTLTIKAQVSVNNLDAYYPFNGNANDESGNGNNGIVNGPILTTDRFGAANKAYQFDGIDDEIVVSNFEYSIQNELSVSFWIKPDENLNITSSRHNFMMLEWAVFQVYYSNGYVYVELFDQNHSVNFYTKQIDLFQYQWYNIAFTCQANSTVLLYINGSSFNIGTAPPIFDKSHTLFTMGRENHQLYFDGTIDDIYIYTRKLNSIEIQALFNDGDYPLSLPIISTLPVSNINPTRAVCGGNITNDGGDSIILRGICWDTQPNPDTSGYKTIDSSGIGTYTSILTELEPNTKYYVRAYAINNNGIAYGNEISFSTPRQSISERLIAYYPFNGNANDESGNGNNGTVYDATLITDKCGNPNSAYYFDGNDDIIIVDHNSMLNPPNITISVWVSIAQYTIWGRIVDKYIYTENTGYNIIIDPGDASFRFEFWGVDNNKYPENSQPIPINTWTHVVSTFDGHTQKIYINGALENSIIINTAIKHTNRYLSIGNGDDGNGYLPFNGTIDEVRIYNYALNDQDIQTLYNTESACKSKPKIIADTNVICRGEKNVSFNVINMESMANYIWSYSGNGAAIYSNSDEIIMDFENDASSGDLKVIGINSVGNKIDSAIIHIALNSCDSIPFEEFNIPNSFTPNGDGINEYFYIRGLTENSNLIVFNRSGKEVYNSSNYLNNWTGKDNKGQALESGTYWYILTLSGYPTVYKGFIYIKR